MLVLLIVGDTALDVVLESEELFETVLNHVSIDFHEF